VKLVATVDHLPDLLMNETFARTDTQKFVKMI